MAEERLTPYPIWQRNVHVAKSRSKLSSKLCLGIGRALANLTMAPKRKAIPEDATAQAGSPTSPKSTSKAKKAKAEKKPEVPETEPSGWVLQHPNMLLSK